MKLLQDILYRTRLVEVVGSTHVAIESIAFDSRQVRPFGLFVAMPGTRVDGGQFVTAAQEAGAVAIVAEFLPAPENRRSGVT